MPSYIVFNMINVNSQSTNATVGVGENAQSNWESYMKTNYGSGEFVGNTITFNMLNVVSDNDFIDSPVNQQDFKPAVSSQV